MALVTGQRSTRILDSITESGGSGIVDLVKKMRRDPRVKLGEQILRSNARSTQVSITPRTQDQRGLFLAALMQDLFDRSLATGLEAAAFGYQPCELSWSSGKFGQYPSKITPLPHESCDVEITGGEPSAVTLRGTGQESIRFERPYFWVSSVKSTAVKPLGESQLEGAVEDAWKERRELVERRRVFARKHVVGTSIVHAPETVEEDGKTVDFHERVADAFRSADAGDVVIFSDNRSIGANGVDGEYLVNVKRDGGECKDASPLIALIDSVDSELLLAFGIPPKTVLEGDAVGSFAMVTQQMLLLMTRVEEILGDICVTFDRDVIRQCSALNFGHGNAFQWNFTPLSQRPDDLANEIVKTCLVSPSLSPLITSGAVDFVKMMELAGIPISADAKSRFEALRNVSPSPSAVSMSLRSPLENSLW